MPARTGRMMRVVDDARTRAVRDELAGDGDDVAGVQRNAWSEIDVVDDVDPKAVFGDDRERLVKRVRVRAYEIPRLFRDRSGHDDISDKTVGRGAGDVDIGVAVEERTWSDRNHIAGAIARSNSAV